MSLFKKDHKPSIMHETPFDPVKMQMQIERSARMPSIMHKTPLDPVKMQMQIERSARKLFPVELAFHHLCMANQAKAKEAKLSKRK